MKDIRGLTSKEVQERIREGKQNGNFAVKTKSIGQIVMNNVCTLFNLINLCLALCLVLVKAYKNIMFMGVVFWNIVIGIVQEVRSKRIIDKLSLLSAPHAICIRDGEEKEIQIEDIVIDDILILKSGNQVCVDSVILEGECEVNESLLTGESDPVYKKAGDEVLSGSFLISGNSITKAIRVGKDNYVNKITSEAKYIKKPNSEIRDSINFIMKCVAIGLFPLAALLFLNQYANQGFTDAVVGAVAGVLGMIPSGLVLLTSMVLAVSVIRLGQKRTLVQELYCIETLARVDTLCLDKTGTITEGTMTVEEVIPFSPEEKSGVLFEEAIYKFTRYLNDDNPTFNALWKYASDELEDIGIEGRDRRFENDAVTKCIPFSSEKKWSLVEFEKSGAFILGAAEFVFKEIPSEAKEFIEKKQKEGLRVLVFAHTSEKIEDKELKSDPCLLGIITLSDTVRKEALETFSYFEGQGVRIKVISGDNPLTVSYVAKKAGICDSENYIDATTLKTDEEVFDASEKYTVFGRVTPSQKLLLVKALKEKGHTVAMTGDGVNDVMALKEADCSVAMQSGSDAARNVSQIVLLDSDFKSMPAVVAEGRRTINNLERSASLYLTKTLYSVVLAVLFIILPFAYPYIPIQLTFIGSLTIGIPSFILAMEPNLNRIKGKFIINVLKMAIPGAMLVVTNIIACIIFKVLFRADNEVFSTLSVFGLAIAALLQLLKCCKPFNKIRHAMCFALISLFFVGIIFFKSFLGLSGLGVVSILFVIGMMIVSIPLYMSYSILVGKLMGSTPNVYKIWVSYVGDRVILVEDEVERKDYYDVAAQMMGLKVLKADKVAFVKKPTNGGHIRVETSKEEGDEDILKAAAWLYLRKNKSLSGEVMVESDFEDEEKIITFDKKMMIKNHMKKLKLTF